jgi:phage recombination protein Bet
MANENGNIGMVKYELDNGQSVELSPGIIRNYLVNGDGRVTDQEVHMFLELCKYQKINPFLREAYLIKRGNGQASMVSGKELFTKRAEKHPDFDGYEAGVIVMTQDKKVQNRPGTTYLPKHGETLVGGWAKVYRKNYRIPIEGTAMFDEYTTNQSTWLKIPATMIRKVALMRALREAFPDMLGGLYSQEELPVDGEKLPQEPVAPEAGKEAASETITAAQAKLLFSSASKEDVRAAIGGFGYQSTKEIRKADFDPILKRLADMQLERAPEVPQGTPDDSETGESGWVTDDEPLDETLPWDTGGESA